MDSVVPSNLAASLGALQIGVFVSHVVFGVTTTQTYIYYSRFPDDSRKIKALVAFVWACDAAHAICMGHTIYLYAISNYGHPERITGVLPKSLMVAVLLIGIIATFVQGFFTFRVYALSRRLYISVIIWVMILLRQLSSGAISFIGMRITGEQFDTQLGWLVAVSLGTSTVTDFAVTATLVTFLRNQRLGVQKRTTALVDKIIAWTIETALMTSVSSIAALACFIIMKGNFIWVAIGNVSAGLFSNSLLASLNSRATLRAMDQATVTLPSLIPAIQPRTRTKIDVQMTEVTQVVYDAEDRRNSCDDEAAKAV